MLNLQRNEGQQTVWIYIEAGCHKLSRSKKGSLPEHPKKMQTLNHLGKKNGSKYIKSMECLTKPNQIFNKTS